MEFLFALFIFPLLSFILGIVGQLLINKIYIVVGITFLIWLIATYTLFNSSFLIWVIIYSILSLLGATIVCFLQRSKIT